jgi:DNA-binding NarL/FixJ family response regulator
LGAAPGEEIPFVGGLWMPTLGQNLNVSGYRKHIAICPYCRRIVKAEHLTYQQWEVAKRLIEGEATAKIAHDLFVSVKTVESHRHRILESLGIVNVPQLIKWAYETGLLDLMGWKVRPNS